jgi:hypothetical protein
MVQDALSRIKNNPGIAELDEEQTGHEVEMEHQDLYDHIKKTCGDSFRMTMDEFAGWISKAHNREDKDYYKKIKLMGL